MQPCNRFFKNFSKVRYFLPISSISETTIGRAGKNTARKKLETQKSLAEDIVRPPYILCEKDSNCTDFG
jgi:hypothetical protein